MVIELDGGQHAIDKDNDQIRDTWLTVEGFKVLRFWNNEIFENMESVLEIIKKKLLSPSPNPSHQGRGDRDNSTLRGISPSGGDRNKLNRRWESGGYTDPVNPV